MQANKLFWFQFNIRRQQHHRMSKMPIEIDSVEYSYTKSFALTELIWKAWAEEIHETENFLHTRTYAFE